MTVVTAPVEPDASYEVNLIPVFAIVVAAEPLTFSFVRLELDDKAILTLVPDVTILAVSMLFRVIVEGTAATSAVVVVAATTARPTSERFKVIASAVPVVGADPAVNDKEKVSADDAF